jgi:hypothetical protein
MYERARRRAGVVSAADLGRNPRRTAARRNLEPLLPGAYLAATQPIDPKAVTTAVMARGLSAYAFAGETALWLYGEGREPALVDVAIPHGTRAALGQHVRVRRVCDDVLAGARVSGGKRVVRLEVAVVQAEVRLANADGASCYADLLHRPTMTVVEMDGFVSHASLERFRADRRRDRWMQAEHGVLTLRVHVGEDLEQVADEVCRVLLRRASEPAA